MPFLQLDISTGSSFDMYQRLNEKVTLDLHNDALHLCGSDLLHFKLGQLELPTRLLSSFLLVRVKGRYRSGVNKRSHRILRILHPLAAGLLLLSLTTTTAFEMYLLRTRGPLDAVTSTTLVLLLVKVQGNPGDVTRIPTHFQSLVVCYLEHRLVLTVHIPTLS